MHDVEFEKVRQTIQAFLELYRGKRNWVSDHEIAGQVIHGDVDDQFVRAVMSVLALFGLVVTAQYDHPAYALQTKNELVRQVTLGSLP